MSQAAVPHCTDNYQRILQKIVDALGRDALREGIKYVGAALTEVQNELDWSYRTDPILPFYRAFLIQLGDALVTVEKLIPSCRRKQIVTIIEVIRSSSKELDVLCAGTTRHAAPGPSIDVFEKEHRARTYGYSPSSRLIYNQEASNHDDD